MNDLLVLIPFLLGLVAVIGVVVLLARALPRLAVLDVDTIREERAKQTKERIIAERFARMHAKKFGAASKALSAALAAMSKAGRRLVQRLYKLEQYYQRLKNPVEAKADPQAVKRLLEQADEWVRQDEPVRAEKAYIEVISHNPKNVDAYEGLGNLYLRNRQYDQARETLKFALRLQPSNASVLVSLGELEGADGQHKDAVDYLRKAVELRAKNPKYLDAYIEAAVEAGLKEDAEKGLRMLKEVNPENQKIAEFEERVESLHKRGGI